MIKFAFYIHNHQPTGNFDEVYEYVYEHSYLPLLKALMKHKTIKFGIHNSGTLLEWIFEKHPEFFEMLKETVKKGQSELLSSAYGEPILSFIPKGDAIEQIKYFNDYLYKHFDYQPKGLWLTERIWEPKLITTLLDAGIEYILLDDTHFLYAGLEEKDLYSYYVTEDEGRILKVFPISMKLRYLIPFHPIDETINFLKEEENRKNNCLKTLGDDGEKFGGWPGTYDWVFKKGWLDEFLSRIEKESWITPVFLHKIANEPSAGRIYVPTSSYEEMGEWVLPPKCGIEYEELKKTIDKKYYYLIHGGYFKNFLRKYPEANHMQKRMLYVSKNVGNDLNAKLLLWKGQCSCAYWHGIFGGLYLPHLREAIYKNLIEAENFNIQKGLKSIDFDADGEKEIVYSDEKFFFVIKPRSASFIEIDDRGKKLNILNYLGRRNEKYHQKLSQKTESEGVKSIHDVLQSKEENLHDYLIYDQYNRSFCLDRMLDSIPTEDNFRRGKEIGKTIDYTDYKILDEKKCMIKFSGQVEKTIQLSGEKNRILQITYQGTVKLFGVEFSVGIFGSKLQLNNDKDLKQTQTLNNLEQFTIQADNFSPIKFSANTNFILLTYPIETISSSETGFEKNFQGFSLLLIFKRLPTISIEL
jgi:alpha-amylase